MKKYLIGYLLIMLFINSNGVAQYGAADKQTALITAVSIKGAVITIDADFVQMLTGKAAIKAAKKEGYAEYDLNKKGDTTWYVPDDYWVSNENTKVRQLTLSANAQIFLIKEGSSSLAKSNAAKLKKSFKGKMYSLTIINNIVTVISEYYTP
jgi:hypothetical protein